MMATTASATSSALPPNDPRIARPIFTLREASAYLGVAKSTIHGWAGRPRDRQRLIHTFPRRGSQATIPFLGFAEAYVLATFRHAGVPLQRIRPAVEALNMEIGLDHALASERLYTDGAEVLYDFASEHEADEVANLVVVRTGQRQFSELVKDYLQRITYADDGWATRLRLPAYSRAEVVVDSRLAFGLPVVAHGGARVEDLVDRFQAGDGVAEIADDFGVPRAEVEDVIRVATQAAA